MSDALGWYGARACFWNSPFGKGDAELWLAWSCAYPWSPGARSVPPQWHELKVGGKWPLKANQGTVTRKEEKECWSDKNSWKSAQAQTGKCFLHLDAGGKINVQGTVWKLTVVGWIIKLLGTYLVVQWLRIRLPMQGTRVWALVLEDPTCRRATKPVRHNYWAHVPQSLKPMCLEPMLHNKRSHSAKESAHHNKE